MIDQDLLPRLGPAGLTAVAIYSGEQTAFGQVVARDAALGLPMLFDLDWQVFERYRIPGGVFPLSVVIDREGNVVHLDRDADLTAAEAAITDAL